MADRYININSAGGGAGTQLSPWNLVDVAGQLYGANVGDTFHIKGYIATAITSDLNGLVGAAAILNWETDEPFAFDVGTYDWVNQSIFDTAHIRGAIVSADTIGLPTLTETCLFYTPGNWVFGAMNPGMTATFKGCTFQGYTIDYISFIEYWASNLTVVFEDCLFVDVLFDTAPSANVTVTCRNCSFKSSQSMVVANFDGTISFDADCRFGQSSINVPSFSACAYEGGKYELNHELYLNGENLGPVGHSYAASVPGLFGEPRRSVGAWLFRRNYYCDVSLPTTGGDGLTQMTAFGIAELQTYFNSSAMELDRIYCFGVGVGITLALPTDLRTWNSLSVLKSYYRGLTLHGLDGKFYMSEASLQSITIGSGNELIDMVTDAPRILSTAQGNLWIYRCTFLNPGGSIGIYASGAHEANIIAGCNFLCDTVSMDGDGTASGVYSSMIACLFADGAKIVREATLQTSLSISDCLFNGTVIGDHDFTCVLYQSNNHFSVPLQQSLPTTPVEYTESGMRFHDYDFGGSLDLNSSLSTIFGPSLIDAWGNVRGARGGDFNFIGSYEPTEYWCDLEGVNGDGTELSPWSAAQLLLYVASGVGYQVADGDIVNIKGPYDASALSTAIFEFSGHPNGANVTFRKWGNNQFMLSYNGSAAFVLAKASMYPINLRVDGMVLVLDLDATGTGGINGDRVNLETYNSQIFITALTAGFALNSSAIVNNTLKMYGSIVSLSISAGGLYNRLGTNSVMLIDTVCNVDTGTILLNTNGSVLLDNVESNQPYSFFSSQPNVIVSNSAFSNADIALLPYIESIATYDEMNYDYRNYSLTILGKGSIFWQSNGYNEGLIGFTRLGIGAFIFPIGEYWVELNQVPTGAGTSISPFNRSQLRDLFGITGHDDSVASIADGDIVNIKGSITDWALIDNYLIDIGSTINGTIVIRGWDTATNGMYILDTTMQSTHSAFYLVHRTSSHYIANLVIKDLCFIQADTGGSSLNLIDGSYPGTNVMVVDLKVCSLFAYTGQLNLVMNFSIANLYGCILYDNGASLFYPSGYAISIYDSALQLVSVDAGASGTLTLVNCETNVDSTDFTDIGATIVFTTCEFNSSVLSILPSSLTAASFSRDLFLYTNYPFISTGSGSVFWTSNDFDNGISGEMRSGIGAFYFYIVIPTLIKTYHPVETVECSEDDIAPRTFWDYISTFWNFLHEKDRNMIENFWHGLWIAGYSLIKKMTRLKEVAAPEGARICVFDDYYDIQLGALYSKPILPDPTDSSVTPVIVPIGKVLIDPVYDINRQPTYNDLIQINARDYYRFREIGIGTYVVINVKRDGIPVKFFKVKNMMSSEEDPSGSRYYQPASLSGKPQRALYMVELDGGNLEYIGENAFSLYFTTGLAYDVLPEVLSVPTLQTFIVSGNGVEFKEEQDYTFLNSIIEFRTNIFDSGITHGQYIYCKKTPIIEHYLFESYGALIGIEDWQRFNYTAISGKAAVNAALKAIQNTSDLSEYNRLMNVFYGLPVAPEDGEIVGLYESYGYEVIDVSANLVTLKIQDGVLLSGLIQDGCEFWIDHKPSVQIESVIDRELGTIYLFDASHVSIGDIMYLHLPNAIPVKSAVIESVGGHPASFVISTNENADMFNHVVSMIRHLSDDKAYPEILVYGTDNDVGYNYDGTYHMTSVVGLGAAILKVYVYHHENDSEPRYNDYVFVSDTTVNRGFLHVQWPTHKFLLVYMKDSNKYYKAYLDAPIDTILKRGDKVSKYQVLSRCVSVVNSDIFPDWNQFNAFKRFNGLDEEVCLVEGTSIIPYAQFGQYLPSEYR